MFNAMATAILFLALVGNAHAHFLWLEREGDGPVRAYFGEYIDGIREKSGGLLDRFKAPRVFQGSSSEPFPVKRNENNLEVQIKGAGDVRFVENGIPPRDDAEKGGKTRTVYYAKHGRSEIAGKLDLEFVPTAANGNTFALLLYGSPLPKAEITIIGPPKWEKPLTTDADGRVTLPMPWAGRYVLETTHFEEKAGGSGAEKYDRSRHIASLSFVQPSGIQWMEKR